MKLLSLTAAAFLFLACASDPLPGYRPATADERASVMQTIEEYYDIVDRAMGTGDLTPLYVRHPKLATGEERQRGVNTERNTVLRTGALDIRDVGMEMEFYEPFRAFLKGDVAVAYSHGLFTWTYANGTHTRGELLVRFDLTRGDGRWMIERSDEWVLGEGTPPPTPR
ncbi:MAG: hypothetical protein M3R54_08785 [Chloroflexota bacterium]|nr:hypothetical protein [Chloroflexota bacterium]